MKLITTVFPGEQIEVTLVVQSKSVRGNDKEPANGSLITRYRSKIGNESLIFNPSIALTIRGRGSTQHDAWVPLPLFYRFTSSLTGVYHNLQKEKLYAQVDGAMYVDRKMALSLSRRLSLYRNSLTLMPGIIDDRQGKPTKAIEFVVDEESIGAMGHVEALSLIDIIDHLDITNYALVAGVVDEMETMNNTIRSMDMKLDRIEKMLPGQLQQVKSKTTPRDDPFNWRSNL